MTFQHAFVWTELTKTKQTNTHLPWALTTCNATHGFPTLSSPDHPRARSPALPGLPAPPAPGRPSAPVPGTAPAPAPGAPHGHSPPPSPPSGGSGRGPAGPFPPKHLRLCRAQLRTAALQRRGGFSAFCVTEATSGPNFLFLLPSLKFSSWLYI